MQNGCCSQYDKKCPNYQKEKSSVDGNVRMFIYLVTVKVVPYREDLTYFLYSLQTKVNVISCEAFCHFLRSVLGLIMIIMTITTASVVRAARIWLGFEPDRTSQAVYGSAVI